MKFSDDHNNVKFMGTNSLPGGKILIRVKGVKSRFKSSTNRKVEILFSNKDKKILDTLCSCPAGKRSTGCAHAVAVLRYILEQQTGNPSRPASLSDEYLDLIDIPSEYISDCDDEEESDEEKDD